MGPHRWRGGALRGAGAGGQACGSVRPGGILEVQLRLRPAAPVVDLRPPGEPQAAPGSAMKERLAHARFGRAEGDGLETPTVLSAGDEAHVIAADQFGPNESHRPDRDARG